MITLTTVPDLSGKWLLLNGLLELAWEVPCSAVNFMVYIKHGLVKALGLEHNGRYEMEREGGEEGENRRKRGMGGEGEGQGEKRKETGNGKC